MQALLELAAPLEELLPLVEETTVLPVEEQATSPGKTNSGSARCIQLHPGGAAAGCQLEVDGLRLD